MELLIGVWQSEWVRLGGATGEGSIEVVCGWYEVRQGGMT